MDSTGTLAMEQAVDWHLRLADGGADVWRSFALWLEADPAHADAYDRLTIEEEALASPMIELPVAPPVVRPVWRGKAWKMSGWATGMAAAAAIGMAVLPTAQTARPYVVETAPGVQRTVTLADGTKVMLNGATRVVLDHADPRIATLESGEAVFDVHHDAEHPFEVVSGGVRLRDIGTVFNVRRAGPALDVAVAEGAVMFQPDHEAVLLKRGATLSMRDDDDSIMLDKIDAEGIGGWRDNRLEFHAVPLRRVAEDLRRTAGIDLAVAPKLADTAFTGSLRTDRPDDEVVATLTALAGARATRSGRGWTIAPRSAGVPQS
ncbi:FecR domain-containing protein [Sphingomonas naphthae]|uniref:FecR domain-containing protein n=1 Tax=Sphingomonas naphthae TaxID=1813468 RepID=A0ABY7TKS5_9SPHN|nr:FecR domain-containing protein [Sphingomonas naphthae]WCT73317.1 FecR domain-containing protein [Sphingomonas naphthae]